MKQQDTRTRINFGFENSRVFFSLLLHPFANFYEHLDFLCLFAGQQLFLRFFLEISPGRPKLILSRMPDVWPLHCATLSVLKRSRITRALTPLAFSKHVGFAARVAELLVPQRRRLKKKQILQNITALNLLQPNSSMHIVRLFSIHFLRCWQGKFV